MDNINRRRRPRPRLRHRDLRYLGGTFLQLEVLEAFAELRDVFGAIVTGEFRGLLSC